MGDEQKQIVAGIRQHYTPEQLVGKLIVVVNNLAPAMLRGETSNGMLLAATSGEKVIVLTPDDPECEPGSEGQVRHSIRYGRCTASPGPTACVSETGRLARVRRDLGDFQTPRDLAAAVLRALGPIGARWTRVLEPTCGAGLLSQSLARAARPPRES